MVVECVVSIGKNGGLGAWNIPADRKRFHQMTEGHVVIMDHETFHEPWPNRFHVVVTTRPVVERVGVFFCTLEQCKAYIHANFDKQRIFVMGGERLYDALEGFVSVIHMTEVFHDEREFSTFFFPVCDTFRIAHVSETRIQDPISYRFVTLVRI